MTTKKGYSKLIKVLERILETFKSDERLSEFERGQVDGLRWAIQLANEADEKNPAIAQTITGSN